MAYMCEKCGIKVTQEVNGACPGCGNVIGAEATPSLTALSADKANSFSTNQKSWLDAVFAEADALMAKINAELKDYPNLSSELTRQVREFCLNKLPEAPTETERMNLNAYCGHISHLVGEYDIAIPFALEGLKTPTTFYKNQSYNTLFRSYTALRQFESAQALEEGALRDGFPDAAYYQMRRALRDRDFPRAIELVAQAYPHDAIARLYTTGQIEADSGDLKKAEMTFLKVISLAGKGDYAGPAINSYCFSVLIPQERYDDAEIQLRRAIEISNPRETANAWSNLGAVFVKRGKRQEALDCFAKAITCKDIEVQNEARYFTCLIQVEEKIESPNSAESDDWNPLLKEIALGAHIGDCTDTAEFLELMDRAYTHLGKRKLIVDQVAEHLSQLRKDSLADIEGSKEWTAKQRILALLLRMYLELGQTTQFEDAALPAFSQATPQLLETFHSYLRLGGASATFRNSALRIESPGFATEWAGYETDPQTLLKLATGANQSTAAALLENPATPDSALVLLADIEDLNTQFSITKHPNVNAEILKKLSNSSFSPVRRGVAASPLTPDEVLRALAIDENPAVREAVLLNPASSSESKALATLSNLN